MKSLPAPLAMLAAVLLVAVSLPAYEYPLSSTSVRDAYFLGKDQGDKLKEFLDRYVQQLPTPKSGPHVSRISVETPFVEAVLRSRDRLNYNAEQAVIDARKKPGVIRVRVRVDLTATYGALVGPSEGVEGVRPRDPDFWRNFSFRFVQSKPIQPENLSGRPIYPPGEYSQLSGAEVEMVFRVAAVSSAPAKVEVDTPDGQHVIAEFDLGALR